MSLSLVQLHTGFWTAAFGQGVANTCAVCVTCSGHKQHVHSLVVNLLDCHWLKKIHIFSLSFQKKCLHNTRVDAADNVREEKQ